MLKINTKSTILFFVLVFYTMILSPVLLISCSNLYFNYINPIVWFLCFIVGFLFFRNDYCRKKYKYDFLQIVIISVIVYLIIFYMSGIVTGYAKLPYARNIKGILLNLIRFVLPLFFMEYVRQCLINRSGKNKIVLIIITGIFAFINILMQTYNFSLITLNDFFELAFSIVIFEIGKSMLLSYLTYRSDFVSSALYAILPKILLYIIPVVPDLNWFLEGSLNILVIFIIYYTCNNFYLNKSIVRSKRKKVYFTIIPLLVILLPIVFLVSGIFKYQLVAILSNSMVPTYSRGDAVLIEKIDTDEKKNKLKKGDVIVFTYNNRRILHRIINISEASNGERIYKTKGDNLEEEDAWYVHNKDIEGKYMFTIYKIGYPSVWISEWTISK